MCALVTEVQTCALPILRLVEDDKAPSKEAGAAFLAIGIRRLVFVTLLLFPQNDVRTGFAAAHLCADLSPLTVGSPSAGLKTVSFGRRPKDETVDAGICASDSTGRPHHRPAVMVPEIGRAHV